MGEFSQKTNEVRSEGRPSCASVQQALIRYTVYRERRPDGRRSFCFGLCGLQTVLRFSICHRAPAGARRSGPGGERRRSEGAKVCRLRRAVGSGACAVERPPVVPCPPSRHDDSRPANAGPIIFWTEKDRARRPNGRRARFSSVLSGGPGDDIAETKPAPGVPEGAGESITHFPGGA